MPAMCMLVAGYDPMARDRNDCLKFYDPLSDRVVDCDFGDERCRNPYVQRIGQKIGQRPWKIHKNSIYISSIGKLDIGQK